MTDQGDAMSDQQPELGSQQFWDERYGAHEHVWSGNVNHFVGQEAAELTPGTALDLGCGEGADAIWLAQRGWQVTAVDLSPVALTKAAREAEKSGVADRIAFEHHDLREAFPAGSFDLVSAQFIHPPAESVSPLLAQAAGAVAPGGTILIANHRSFPSFVIEPEHDVHFPDEDEVIAAITSSGGEWDLVRTEEITREVTAPDGQAGTHTDFVVRMQRR
jgi:SAM-dependent methyltransferase